MTAPLALDEFVAEQKARYSSRPTLDETLYPLHNYTYAPDRNLIDEMTSAIGVGSLDASEMVLKALDTLGLGTQPLIDDINAYRQRSTWDDPSQDMIEGTFQGKAAQAVQSFVQNMGTRLGGMVAGGIAGAPAGIPGIVAGMAIGGTAVGGPLYGLAEYYDFMADARRAGIPESAVKSKAVMSAFAEGGLEMASDVAFDFIFGLPGLLGKGAVKGAAKEAGKEAAEYGLKRILGETSQAFLDKPGLQTFLKAYIPKYLATAAEEVPTEMLQSFTEQKLRESAGIPNQPEMSETLKQTAEQTAAVSILFGLAGMGGMKLKHDLQQSQKAAGELLDKVPDSTESRPLTADILAEIKRRVTDVRKKALEELHLARSKEGGKESVLNNLREVANAEGTGTQIDEAGRIVGPEGASAQASRGDIAGGEGRVRLRDTTKDRLEAQAGKVIDNAEESVTNFSVTAREPDAETLLAKHGLTKIGDQFDRDGNRIIQFNVPETRSTDALPEGFTEKDLLDKLERHYTAWDMPDRANDIKAEKAKLEEPVAFEASSEAAGLIERAKAKFGLTQNVEDAGYILPDGSMLSLKQSNNIYKRDFNHDDVDTLFDRKEWHPVGAFMDQTGAIRVSLIDKILHTSFRTKLTMQQEETLQKFISKTKSGYGYFAIEGKGRGPLTYGESKNAADWNTAFKEASKGLSGKISFATAPVLAERSKLIQDQVDVISAAVKGVKVELVNDEEMQRIAEERNPNKFKAIVDNGGRKPRIVGIHIADEKRVLINKDFANRDAVPHEFGHAVLEWMRQNQREDYAGLLDLTRETDYERQVREVYAKNGPAEDAFSQARYGKDFGELNSVQQAAVNIDISNEALAHALGDKGAQLHEEARNKFMYMLKKLWSQLSIGFKRITKQDLTFDEWVEMLSYKMRSPGAFDVSQGAGKGAAGATFDTATPGSDEFVNGYRRAEAIKTLVSSHWGVASDDVFQYNYLFSKEELAKLSKVFSELPRNGQFATLKQVAEKAQIPNLINRISRTEWEDLGVGKSTASFATAPLDLNKEAERVSAEDQAVIDKKRIQKDIHSWARQANWSDEERKAFQQNIVGKRSTADMSLDELRLLKQKMAPEITKRLTAIADAKTIRENELLQEAEPKDRTFLQEQGARARNLLRKVATPIAKTLYPEAVARWKHNKEVVTDVILAAFSGEAARNKMFQQQLEAVNKSVADMVVQLDKYDDETLHMLVASIAGDTRTAAGEDLKNLAHEYLRAKHPELLEPTLKKAVQNLYDFNFKLMQELAALTGKDDIKLSGKLFYGRYEAVHGLTEALRQFLGISQSMYATSDAFFQHSTFQSYADAMAAGRMLKQPNIFRNLLDETSAIGNMIGQAKLRDKLMETGSGRFIIKRGTWVSTNTNQAYRLFKDSADAEKFVREKKKESVLGKAHEEARSLAKEIVNAKNTVRDQVKVLETKLVNIAEKIKAPYSDLATKKEHYHSLQLEKNMIEQEIERTTKEANIVIKELIRKWKIAEKYRKGFRKALKETSPEYFIGETVVPPSGWKPIGAPGDPVWNNQYFAEPDMGRVVNNALQVNQVTRTPALNSLRKAANMMRFVKFAVSTFHHMSVTKQALADVPQFMGFLNPKEWSTYKAGKMVHFGFGKLIFASKQIRNMILNDPDARAIYNDLLTYGLNPFGEVSTYSMEREAARSVEWAYKKSGIPKLLKASPDWLRATIEAPKNYNKWLFEFYIPTIQASRAINEVVRLENKLGRSLTPTEKLEVVKQGMFLEGEVNEKIYGRSGTVTSLLRFPFMAPGYAEGNIQTIYNSLTKWKDPQGARNRYAVLNSFMISTTLAGVATAIFTGKWRNPPKDEDELRDMFKIDTGTVDYKGRKVMIDLLTFDKDYYEVYKNILLGSPQKIPKSLFTRLGGMHSGLVGFTRDLIDISEGRAVVDWKGDKVYHMTDPFLVKVAKYGINTGEELKPISFSVYVQSRQRKTGKVLSFMEAAAGVRSTTSEKDRKEMEWVRNLFDMREKREEQFRFLDKEKNPYKTLKYYNSEVDRALTDKNLPPNLKEEFESLHVNIDNYIGYTINRLTDPTLQPAQRARIFDILNNFGVPPSSYRSYVQLMRRSRREKGKETRKRNRLLRATLPQMAQYNFD